MSFARLFASLVLLVAACNPTTPRAGDDAASPPDARDAPMIDAGPDIDAAPPVEAPGRAVEVTSGAGRLSATAGGRHYTFDILVGGTLRGRTGDGTKTLDAAPVLR